MPLALFWLVLGFFQQQTELRLNTKALENQVAETRALVNAATTQANAGMIQAQAAAESARIAGEHLKRLEAAERANLIPQYEIKRTPPYRVGDTFARFSIANIGRAGTDVRVFAPESFEGYLQLEGPAFLAGETTILTLGSKEAGISMSEANFFFQIRSTAEDGSRSAKSFRYRNFSVTLAPSVPADLEEQWELEDIAKCMSP
ncbi:MAG: hypothetical protein KIT73_13910 [Burkholderiales bacterium]|nr:hypothetical protein [Burkholderiales bacterium]